MKLFNFIHLCLLLLFSLYIGYIIIIGRLNYKNLYYLFGETELNYKLGYYNIERKNIDYKHIKEIRVTSSGLQRIFNLGTIILSTSAEGASNGVKLINVKNPTEVAREVKEVVGI